MTKKINQRNKKNALVLGIFQILLMISFSFSGSYLISASLGSFNGDSVLQEKNTLSKPKLLPIIKKVGDFLSLKGIGIVSAGGETFCCGKVSGGEFCGQVDDINQCDEGYGSSIGSCSDFEFCEVGTCITKEGTCSAQSIEKLCEDNRGEWKEESIEEISECTQGCCTLDSGDKQYVTRAQCEGSFNHNTPRHECRVLTEDKGACINPNNRQCVLETEIGCDQMGWEFEENFLCSHPDLNTTCDMPEEEINIRTKCENDRVHFLDTCGNIANIYDMNNWDDENYWGIIRSPEDSCDLDDNEIEECGNCEAPLNECASIFDAGGKRPEQGGFICRDNSCTDDDGETRQHGEAWCVYESHLGENSDVVGSSHRISYCLDGEIRTDICGDGYRGDICGEQEIGGFSYASCRPNMANLCLLQNEYMPGYWDEDGNEIPKMERDEWEEECEAIPDCRVLDVDVDKYFKFDTCVPKYPIGNPQGESKEKCEIASQDCTVFYERKSYVWGAIKGSKDCVENCECLDYGFVEQMNDFCVSLGDCGGFVNVEGEYTKNFRFSRNINHEGDLKSGKINEYKRYASENNFGNGDLPLYLLDPSTSRKIIETISMYPGEIKGSWMYEHPEAIGTALTTISVATIIGTAFAPGIGTIIGLVVGIIAAAFDLFRKVEVIEETVNFECQQWRPPVGGDDCSRCDDDQLRPCTEYKCKSLGSACELMGDVASENPVCYNAYESVRYPPKIVFDSVKEGYNYETQNNRVEVRESNECIEEGTSIDFKLKTEVHDEDETGLSGFSECVWGWEPINPPGHRERVEGEMFETDGAYSKIHSFSEKLPSIYSRHVDIKDGSIALNNRIGEANVYVKCQNRAGIFNRENFVVNFCIEEIPNDRPPIIEEFIPESGSYLKYNETEEGLKLFTNKPAKCSWTLDFDKPYNEMNQMEDCNFPDIDEIPENTTKNEEFMKWYEGEILKENYGGWYCNTELTNLTKTENNIFIKCQDIHGNVNDLGYEYALHSTENKLEIDSVYLVEEKSNEKSELGNESEDIVTIVGGGDSLIELRLGVTTKGGLNEGDSICTFRIKRDNESIGISRFLETGGKRHEQTFTPGLSEGKYTTTISCKDEVRNEDEKEVKFNIEIDDKAPIVVRAYKENDYLRIITNKPSECVYSHKEDSSFDDGKEMTSDREERIHSTRWQANMNFYIICTDEFENMPDEHSIVVRPFSV